MSLSVRVLYSMVRPVSVAHSRLGNCTRLKRENGVSSRGLTGLIACPLLAVSGSTGDGTATWCYNKYKYPTGWDVSAINLSDMISLCAENAQTACTENCSVRAIDLWYIGSFSIEKNGIDLFCDLKNHNSASKLLAHMQVSSSHHQNENYHAKVK